MDLKTFRSMEHNLKTQTSEEDHAFQVGVNWDLKEKSLDALRGIHFQVGLTHLGLKTLKGLMA